MGIEDLLESPPCPKCEEEGQPTEQYYLRCENDSCNVITWIEVNYTHTIE